MNKITFLVCLMLIGLFSSCSDDDNKYDRYVEGPHASFLRETMVANAGGGTLEIVVDWQQATWEVTVGEGDIVESVTPTTGGSNEGEKQYTKIEVICHPNTTLKERTQTLYLTDKTNNLTTEMRIEQEMAYKQMTVNIDPTMKYQPVVGFGGMYNPIIWCGGYLITTSEMEKMYGQGGLGYSVLRLMIYPNESDWQADVEAAKMAQDNGAIIFACPWDCTDALSETIKVNDKDVKHLKVENYEAYADHLIRYIDFMKKNGVNLYAISMQNEPDMEFTYWTPQEVVNFLKQCGDRIRQTGVKLMSPEACGTSPDYTDPVLADSEAFAQTDIVAGHLYQGFIDWTNSYAKTRYDYVCGLYPRLQGKTWWMTEHLFNDGESSENPAEWEFQNWDYCLNHLGKEIHLCMDGYCSAYVYWYLKRFYGLMGDNDQRSAVGEGEISKNGYIMAHYAQYATGTTRIQAVTDNSDVYVTAYTNDSGNEITLVMLNLTGSTQCVSIPMEGVTSVSAVETNEEVNMKAVTTEMMEGNAGVSVVLSGNSISSVRISL